MADIFISYAREDRETVAKLAAALEDAGYSLWWDRHIVGGAEFSADIEREIGLAKAVIVAWSAHGNASHWVKDEAAIARDAGKLVPLSLDGCEPPIGFRQFHALPFAGWKDDAAEAVAALKESVKQKIDGAAPPAASAAAFSSARQSVPSVWQIPAARLSLIAAALITALAAAALVVWRPWETGGPARGAQQGAARISGAAREALAPPGKSIAVLPFVDMSEKKDQEYFTDGLSEEMIDLIAKIPELRVTARTSSFSFKGKQATIAEIAKALNVAHVLEGSVRKSGDRLRITAQLIRTSDSSHLWSETYDRTLDDIFKVQDEIAQAVVKELKVSLLGGSSGFQGGPSPAVRLRDAPTANTEAYTAYLMGRAHSGRYTPADNQEAIAYFRQSVAIDPNFGDAWAWLALSRVRRFGLYGGEEDYGKYVRDVKEYVARALAADPNSAVGHAMLAFTLWSWEQDPGAAEKELGKAIALDPADAGTLLSAGLFYLGLGRFEEAVEMGRRAVDVDPRATEAYRSLGTSLYFSGNLAEAEKVFRQSLAINPGTGGGMRTRLAMVLISAGRPQEALAEAMQESRDAWRRFGMALAYDALGKRTEADRALGDPEQLAGEGLYYQLAQFYAHRGDKENAFAMLERGYAKYDPGVVNYLRVDPLLEPLRTDPRYKALVKTISTPRRTDG